MSTLRDRHDQLVPMGTMVSSKGRFRYCDGFGPEFIIDGDGCQVKGSNDKWYVDWACGLGAITLGHRRGLMGDAISWPMPSTAEVDLAELVCRMVPCAEAVRFMKNGSDATAAAVRLARAFTGREKIVRCGYHGWNDIFLNADYAEKKGVPQCVRDLTVSVPFGDLESLEDHLLKGDVAAFILEPAPLCAPKDWYLRMVKDSCEKVGTVLIFDEVITGFRMAAGGAQQVYGVTPDLTAAGKAMGNGHPISVVCGRHDIMECWGETHLSGTHFGEVHAMRAAVYTLSKMDNDDFWQHQAWIGKALIDGYTAAAAKHNLSGRTRIRGLPHHTNIEWDNPAQQTLFTQEMLRHGVMVASGQFVCLAHNSEAVEQTVKAYDESMAVVADALGDWDVTSRLECKINTVVFRRNR
jgi:glutamate-1-semialdehyde 2,1-aminomutase